MAILTLDVSDTVAQTVAQLSAADRTAYLARMNVLAEANLPTAQKNGNGLHDGKDAETDDEMDEEDEWPDDIFVTHPLPPSLTQSVAEIMREAREAVDAGQIIDGETFLANLRRRAEGYRAEAEGRRHLAGKTNK